MDAASLLDQHLARCDHEFTTACQSILRQEIPEWAAYGSFWFQPDPYHETWTELPLSQAWVTRRHGHETVPDSPLFKMVTEPWEPPEDLDEDDCDIHVFRWVHRCWISAGGDCSRPPFYAQSYKGIATFCLHRGRYIAHEELEEDLTQPRRAA